MAYITLNTDRNVFFRRDVLEDKEMTLCEKVILSSLAVCANRGRDYVWTKTLEDMYGLTDRRINKTFISLKELGYVSHFDEQETESGFVFYEFRLNAKSINRNFPNMVKI